MTLLQAEFKIKPKCVLKHVSECYRWMHDYV